ncbi:MULTISPECIES: hypothetical protein [unclassified Rhizobium]|uniref:hypothetical protein n=1 Tax=unclassified Rhizobium TaxID=2613769 RepID=UPI001AE8D535|nr:MULTISPECIES: hypothetical protein [unclassified Rhizobium]MBP2463059.1 ferric iron reductase protein FhuF [Rhizobium sp. PvP014]MBP2530453.1 ferric iron reductase protein FhuF [Rhizobium sp. PvP099]
MKRPEDETGAVDEEEMIAFFHEDGIPRGIFGVHEKFAGSATERSPQRYRFVIDQSLEKPHSAAHFKLTGD